jgi:hypothetical protein
LGAPRENSLMPDSIERLRELERECVARFEEKARLLRLENPSLSPSVAFSRAVASLPKTAQRYRELRQKISGDPQ